MLDTRHHKYWKESCECSQKDEGRKKKLLSSAVLGHYRALCSLSEVDFKKVSRVVRRLRHYRYHLEMLKGLKWMKARIALQEQVKQYEDSLLDFIQKYGTCPKVSDKYLFSVSLSMVPLTRRVYYYLRNAVLFLDFLVYGANTFFKKSAEKRKRFCNILENAESGMYKSRVEQNSFTEASVAKSVRPSSLYEEQEKKETGCAQEFNFTEHKIRPDDASKPVLEAMSFERQKRTIGAQTAPKNIVIYTAGWGVDYTTNTPFALNMFWSLPSCDALWQVNLRNVSLSAGGHTLRDKYLEEDLSASIDSISNYYQSNGESINITVVSHCAGSPVAANVVRKRNVQKKEAIKFFSDRSFISVDKVADTQLFGLWNSTLLVRYMLFYLALPLRVLKERWISLRDLNLNQGRLFKDIDPALRKLHVCVAPKKERHLPSRSDIIHLDLGASLHTAMSDEDKVFDLHFLGMLKKLDCDAVSHEKVSKTRCLEHYAQEGGAHSRLLQLILSWHKDRKSCFNTKTGGCTDTHNHWPSGLSARGSGRNPFWRLNIFIEATHNDMGQFLERSGLSDVQEWDPDLQYILDTEKVWFVHLLRSREYIQALRALNESLCRLTKVSKQTMASGNE